MKVMPQWRLVHGRCLAQPGCQAALQHPAGAAKQKCENGRGRAGWGACLGHSAVGYVFPDHLKGLAVEVGTLTVSWMARLLATLSRRAVGLPPYTAAPAPSPNSPLSSRPLATRPTRITPSGFWLCALSSAPWRTAQHRAQ